MKIAVCVHLYHTDMWEEIENYLNNLTLPYKLYVNLPYETDGKQFLDFQWDTYVNYYQDLKKAGKDNHQKAYNHFIKHGLRENRFYRKDHLEVFHKISNFKNDSIVFLSPNKGLDLGGFLYTYKHIESDCDLILKIHTKKGMGSKERPSRELEVSGFDKAFVKGKEWFNSLMNGVLLSESQVKKIINNFKTDIKLGMVGYKTFNNFSLNYSEMEKLFFYFNMKGIESDYNFIGGTIFWCRNSILKKYLTDKTIDEILGKMTYGYVVEPSINHAMERILGCIVYLENKEIKIIK
jgi:lipopolysaccharide biosynthesis protein